LIIINQSFDDADIDHNDINCLVVLIVVLKLLRLMMMLLLQRLMMLLCHVLQVTRR